MPETPGLRIRTLSVMGDKGRQILSIPTLDIAPGSRIGIRGPSGAGKSTFLHAIAGLLETAKGEVVWGETNLTAQARKNRTTFRRQHIGMIFQDFMLFDELSPAMNASISALFAPKAERDALKASAMTALADRGIEPSDRTIASFSGGERQRVAVARALAHDPPIILADEPTASLDPSTSDALVNDLVTQSQAKGRTLIVVSHDQRLLARMDRVLTIADGALQNE